VSSSTESPLIASIDVQILQGTVLLNGVISYSLLWSCTLSTLTLVLEHDSSTTSGEKWVLHWVEIIDF
jgi:hypothetical protein